MERIHSLYLHVPFCTWVCKYCDFNAYAVLEGLIPPYVDALSREIDVAAAELPVGPLETVFIGGGTPSLLTGAQVRQVMEYYLALRMRRLAGARPPVQPMSGRTDRVAAAMPGRMPGRN